MHLPGGMQRGDAVYLRQEPTGRSAALFAMTVGLVLPALAFLWLTGGLVSGTRPAPEPEARPPAAVASVPPPLPGELGSRWLSQSAPAAILVNGIARITMTFENVGSVPWVKGTASEVRLGVVGDSPVFHEAGFALDWPMPSRVAVQSEKVVRPGEHATFVFRVRGVTAGTIVIPLRPVVDGVSWLNAEGAYVEIVVGAISLRGPLPNPS